MFISWGCNLPLADRPPASELRVTARRTATDAVIVPANRRSRQFFELCGENFRKADLWNGFSGAGIPPAILRQGSGMETAGETPAIRECEIRSYRFAAASFLWPRSRP
jgi:hypothetical protein